MILDLNYKNLSGMEAGMGFGVAVVGGFVAGATGAVIGDALIRSGNEVMGKTMMVAASAFALIANSVSFYFLAVGSGVIGATLMGPTGLTIGSSIGITIAILGVVKSLHQFFNSLERIERW